MQCEFYYHIKHTITFCRHKCNWIVTDNHRSWWHLYITKSWSVAFNVAMLPLSHISSHVITLIFSKFSHYLKILFLNIFYNFKILLKRNDFHPYLHHKAQSYVNVVNVVFNANPYLPSFSLCSSCLSHFLNFKIFTFLMPNSLSSLLGLFISSESLLCTCSIATLLKTITSSYLFIS